MTSVGVGPRKKYISKTPPIVRKVIAGDGCNITSTNSERYDAYFNEVYNIKKKLLLTSFTHCITIEK